MSLEQWVAVVGTVAALCTTLAFVPQILKTWRTGGRDLSYGMLLVYLAGIVLWLVYGLLIWRMAIIAANLAAMLLVSLNLGLKRWAEGRGAPPPPRPPRRLRVAIDMDETIADSLGKQIGSYNETFGDRLSPADLEGQHLHEAVPADRADHARELFHDPAFFEDLALIKGSREVIRELAERHEVFIASAAMEVPTSFAAKYAWLREHFPFIPTSHLVFCGDKSVLDVDVLIDDTPRHFERFRGTPILFSAPHNRQEKRYRRVSSWDEVRRVLLLLVLGAAVVSRADGAAGSPSFADDVAFLQAHGPIRILRSPSGAQVAVSAAYQGRVMTSAVDRAGASLGWINRPFIAAGKTGTPFDNYGGEDRFWLGPEGGQFGLYFAPGKPFTFAEWQTPSVLQEGAWDVKEADDDHVTFTRRMAVTNHSGTPFSVEVERVVRLLPDAAVAAHLGIDVTAARSARAQWVAFETTNRITNVGPEAWTRERGLLSVWILAMYAPSPDAHVVIPFDREATGTIVNDAYFGKVPPDRLAVKDGDGYLVFKCDGLQRGKIGLPPSRAREALGSYSASARLLTVVQYDKPKGAREYVNSMWEVQKEPYSGDVVNSYNDGSPGPGLPPLGGFYELETSSPAAALGPRESLSHTHRTFHFVGDRAALDPIAVRVLGVSASRIGAGEESGR